MESGSELPTEIVCFQILPRLPARSLVRFKCVCKSWPSLISNPAFVRAHQDFHLSKLIDHLLLTTWDEGSRQQHFLSAQISQQGIPSTPTHLLSLLIPPYAQRLYNAQCIKGLVCLYLSNTVFPWQNINDRDHPIRILNPSTRVSIILPHSLPSCSTAHVTHHFGFSPLTNEYKVLQVQMFRDSPTRGMRLMFRTFKLGTSLWRQVEVDLNDLSFDPLKCPFHRPSVCVNGSIHWLHGSQNVIVVFDIGDERFRSIPLPEDYNCVALRFNFPCGNIVEVGGCMALIGDKELVEQNMMGLWILKDYENQVWVKETIVFPFVWSELGYPVPFCTIHSDELLFQSSKSSRQQDPANVRLYLYNMRAKSFRGSEIVLPAEWISADDTRLTLLTSFDDSIMPLT